MTNTGNTTTAATATLARITMARVFESLIMDVNALTNEIGTYYDVTVMTFDGTSRGAYVGADARRVFNTEAAARQFANGWFASLRGKGWKRTA